MTVHYDRYVPVGKKATNPGTQFGREAVRWKFINYFGYSHNFNLDLLSVLKYSKTILYLFTYLGTCHWTTVSPLGGSKSK